MQKHPEKRTARHIQKTVGGAFSRGGDRRFNFSVGMALLAHIMAIVVIPFILSRGCSEDPYAIQKGKGMQKAKIIKIKRIKKEDRYILNMDSAISFYKPKLDDERLKDLEKETADQYKAKELTGIGKGGPGKGGWPNGMDNARVRFIRLEYSGGDWDQDMGADADYNLLLKFNEYFPSFKVAENTEHRPIKQLRRFPAHKAPPFVFITGRGGISVSAHDVETLRWYCLQEGGMIFADNGGGHFDRSFRALAKKAFPRLTWIDIPNDDVIFRIPNTFPNGAPPLWHHSGTRAMGLKYKGRWVVFYHQGDLNDAWKTGHSGASDDLADQAYRLGINVINYSFNQYMNFHHGKN